MHRIVVVVIITACIACSKGTDPGPVVVQPQPQVQVAVQVQGQVQGQVQAQEPPEGETVGTGAPDRALFEPLTAAFCDHYMDLRISFRARCCSRTETGPTSLRRTCKAAAAAPGARSGAIVVDTTRLARFTELGNACDPTFGTFDPIVGARADGQTCAPRVYRDDGRPVSRARVAETSPMMGDPLPPGTRRDPWAAMSCGSNLFCLELSGEATCRRRREVGERCFPENATYDDGCAAGGRCPRDTLAGGFGAAPSQPSPPPAPPAPPACQPIPVIALGASCTRGSTCAQGSSCTQGTCQPRTAESVFCMIRTDELP